MSSQARGKCLTRKSWAIRHSTGPACREPVDPGQTTPSLGRAAQLVDLASGLFGRRRHEKPPAALVALKVCRLQNREVQRCQRLRRGPDAAAVGDQIEFPVWWREQARLETLVKL